MDLDLTRATRTGTGRSHWPRLIDAAFGAIVIIWSFHWFRVSEGEWFYLDDWRLLVQASADDRFLEPYNRHLSVVILGVYRLLADLFGLGSYVPFRIAHLTSFGALAVAVYLLARQKVGALIAAALATALLWSNFLDLQVAVFNHYLSLLGAVGCAWAIGRPSSRATNAAIAVSLGFALAAASGGVPVAAACVVSLVLVRPPRERVLAVVAPIGLWLGWMVIFGGDNGPHGAPEADLRAGESLARVLQGLFGTFQQLGFGSIVGASVLVVVFFARLVWLADKRDKDMVAALSWGAAVLVWWVGLVVSRKAGADPNVFRYTFVPAVYLVLAMLPITDRREALEMSTPETADRAVMAVVALCCWALVAATITRGNAETYERNRVANFAASARAASATMLLDAAAVDGRAIGPVSLYHLTADEVRALAEQYPLGVGDSPEEVDALLVELSRLTVSKDASGPACTASSEKVSVAGTEDVPVLPAGVELQRTEPEAPIEAWIRSPSKESSVEVRRFGSSWIVVGSVPAGAGARLALPAQLSKVPWQVRAAGACITTDRP